MSSQERRIRACIQSEFEASQADREYNAHAPLTEREFKLVCTLSVLTLFLLILLFN